MWGKVGNEEGKLKWKDMRELGGGSLVVTIPHNYDYLTGMARNEPYERNVHQPTTATTTPGCYVSPHLAGTVRQVALTRDSLGAYISFTPHGKGKNSYIECPK